MRRRGSRRVPGAIDNRTMAEAVSVPGVDPRDWASFGIVDGGDAESPVVFHEESGQPYVLVTLEPSKRPAMCRVGMEVAGNGEGDWVPFLNGDEVLVVMPEGREDNAVIVKRLANKLDAFPMSSVAGQDPTTNSFGFRRRRTPFIEEYSGPVFFRSASTGAFFSIDSAGTVTIKDGENAALQLGPDAFQYSGPSSPTSPPEFLLQFALTQRQFMVQCADAFFCLSASDGTPEVNSLTVPGSFQVATVGNAAGEHVVTTEALMNILANYTVALSALTAGFTAPPTPSTADPLLAGIVATAALSSTWSSWPLTRAAIQSGFAAMSPKPASLPGSGQSLPGIGCPGFFSG